MSISMDQQSLASANRAISDLYKRDASAAKKVADCTAKMNRATSAASRTPSEATARSKISEAERAAKDIENAQKERAALAGKIGQKASDIAKIQERITRKQADQEKKRIKASEDLQKKQERRLKAIETAALPRINRSNSNLPRVREIAEQHDVFISHASEDKEGFVAAFADAAKKAGIDVWYDQFSLKWGDSLRQSIDRGLASSYFGIVILSENFFKKEWTNYELDGLIQKESIGRGGVLPIWHKVTKDEVTGFSPPLANRLALNTSNMSIDEIVQQLKSMVDEIKALG